MRSHITGYDVANDIRMTRSQYSGCFLIVEGETADLRVYKRFVNERLCQVTPAHNKDNAIQAIEILNHDNFDGVLAIVDADFWRLENRSLTFSNLFITDAHDLEMMILQAPALEKLLDEFGSPKKIRKFVKQKNKNIRQVLLDIGCPVGYLRWVSIQQNLSLTFESIAFRRFIDRKTLVLNVSELIRTVINKSNRPDLKENDLQKSITELTNPEHDPWDICCGHDLICILSVALRTILGSNNTNDIKPEHLEKSLRLAYETAYFLETQLYQTLKVWEQNNRPFQIFP